jgi:hypothetical protein
MSQISVKKVTKEKFPGKRKSPFSKPGEGIENSRKWKQA